MPDTNEIETFKEELEENMHFLNANLKYVDDDNLSFAESLCNFYETKGFLTRKQLEYALKFWREAMDARPANSAIQKLPTQKDLAPAPSNNTPVDSQGYTREQHNKLTALWLDLSVTYNSVRKEDVAQECIKRSRWHHQQAAAMLADVGRFARNKGE